MRVCVRVCVCVRMCVCVCVSVLVGHARTYRCKAKGRPGVAVEALVERDMAYRCGLRVNDVIVNMSGLPCRRHGQCIQMINQLSQRESTDESILCLRIPGAAAMPVAAPLDPEAQARGVALADEDDEDDADDAVHDEAESCLIS